MSNDAVVIEPRGLTLDARFGELWQRRRLIGFFWKRSLERRYLRTWLGWIWLPLKPIIETGSRVFVFGGVLSIPTQHGIPYLVFFLVGMSAWGLFEETTYWATRSLEMNRSLLRKVYVPRLAVLLGGTSIGIVNFLIYVAITTIAIVCYGIFDGVHYLSFEPRLLLTLAGLGLLLLLAVSLGLWLAPLGAQARDVRMALRYATSFWFFLTPVVYPLSKVPSGLRPFADFNPVTAPVELVKHGLLGVSGPPAQSLITTLVFVTVALVGGLWFFGRAEVLAADAL